MRKLLLSLLAATALVFPARADVILDTSASGTGDNVVFDSFNGTNLAIGSFNGQHQGFVFFRDLSGNGAFTGAANGQDIKISNTSDLDIKVFANDKVTLLGTSTDVFSIVGTGTLTITALATDGPFTFTEALKNGQNFFTLTAIKGEVITDVDLKIAGGSISDFEHYRVDVAPLAVPGPVVGAGLPGILTAAAMALLGLVRRRRAAALAA
jgi:hypothetical protein